MISINLISPATEGSFPSWMWMNVVQFLDSDDLKSLRLSGGRELCDPLLTSHLSLRVDHVPFFGADKQYTSRSIRRWLYNRKRLVINGHNKNIHPARVAYLVKNGYLDSVSQVVVYDASRHGATISQLVMLPSIKALKLVDHHLTGGRVHSKEHDAKVQENLDAIVDSLHKMSSLKVLDIEVDSVLSGRRLSTLESMKGLKDLRLRGFDFSEGIRHIGSLTELENIHLCHGNFYSSPEKEISEEDLLVLSGFSQIKSVHLEGFDAMTDMGLKPFCQSKSMKRLVMKHCQDLSGDSCSTIGAMASLESLHIVNSAYDDVEDWESEHLVQLLPLKELKTLSLFYVLIDQYDILDLEGLDNLETLNVAFTIDMNQDEFSILCNTILPIFPSLKKLRVFGEDLMEQSMRVRNIDIEFASFNLGDVVELD
ncbi:hypothetical protein ACHAXN_002683 [Cyclotella atomus]